MRHFSLHKRSALLGFLLLGTFALGLAGAPDIPMAQSGIAAADALTIGPGKVEFRTCRDGRWVSFVPEWTSRSLFVGGGIVVFSADANGDLRQIASTRDGLEPRGGAPATGYHEGIPGGSRRPSVNADDDSDGRIDEDRLDGIDNDGDGRRDEDFAAVGDEMTVARYRTRPNAGPSLLGQVGPIALAFHQEQYAWSLPHIDGTVMMSLWIRNTSYETLRDVYVGAIIEKAAPFTYAERTSSYLISGTEPVEARSVMLTDRAIDGGSCLALMGFMPAGAGTVWSGGYVRNASDVLQAVRTRAGAKRPDPDPRATPVETEISGEDAIFAFAFAPKIGTLDPGQEVLVQFALIAMPPRANIEDALSVVLQTYAGDGHYRFLPPPVAMTPRVLWGTYYPVGGETRGVAIDFDALGDNPVGADQVSYLSGVEPRLVDRSELRPGVTRLVLRGEAADRVLEKTDRVVLKGRLRSGEFFEANLRPDDGTQKGIANGPSEDAEHFWRIPGKLDDVLGDGIELLSNTPNPFREATTVHYEIPALIEQENGMTLRTTGALDTSVKIYDVRGRLVTTLIEEQVPPGVHAASWAGVDDMGHPVPSGVYFIKLQIGQKFLTRRVTVVR